MNASDSTTPLRRTGACALALAAALTGNPACADTSAGGEPVPYAALHGGVNRLDHWPTAVGLGNGVGIEGQLGLDAGRAFGLQVGLESRRARVELEHQRGRFDIRSVALGAINENVQASGRYQATTVNVYGTQPIGDSLGAYLAAGVGYGSASLPAVRFANGCECLRAASRDGWVFQARAGIESRFGDGHRLFAQVSGLSMPGPRAGNDPGVSYRRATFTTLHLGYRRHF